MVRTARATATVAGAFPQTFIILPSSNYNFCIYSFYAYLEFKFLSHLLRDSAVDGPLNDDATSATPTLDPPDLLSALSLSQSNDAVHSSNHLSSSSASLASSAEPSWDIRRRSSNPLALSSASVSSFASNVSNASSVSSVSRQAL